MTGAINAVGSIHHAHLGLDGGFTSKTAVTTAIVPLIILVKFLVILSFPVAVLFYSSLNQHKPKDSLEIQKQDALCIASYH